MKTSGSINERLCKQGPGFKREMKDGFEMYTITLPPDAMAKVGQRIQDPALGDMIETNLKKEMARYYILQPPIDHRDIMLIEADVVQRQVRIYIRRGHYTLLALIHSHKDVLIKENGEVRCSCHEGVLGWMNKDSLPTYLEEFDAQVQQHLEEAAGNLPSQDAEGSE